MPRGSVTSMVAKWDTLTGSKTGIKIIRGSASLPLIN